MGDSPLSSSLVGDLGCTLKTRGRLILHPSFSEEKSRRLVNLYTTSLRAVGAPRDHFGMKDPNNPSVPQNGVVAELFA